MSFTVNFDGLFNENTNIIQMVSTESLNKSVLVRQPVTGEYYSTVYPYYKWTYRTGFATVYVNWVSATNISALGVPSSQTSFVSGGYTYYRGAYVTTVGSDPVYKVYRTYIGNTPVTIADSTDTEGSPLTGGSAITETITETQKGQAIDSGVGKDVGLIVKDGGTEIVRASHYAPAQSGEPTEATVSSAEVFTATSTDLTVESYGTGDGHSLQSEDTKILLQEK